jgi:hypothetical protein
MRLKEKTDCQDLRFCWVEFHIMSSAEHFKVEGMLHLELFLTNKIEAEVCDGMV